MAQLKAGLKLKSAVCTAEVMIVKPGAVSALTCGGSPMLAPGESAPAGAALAAGGEGCKVGKRYVNADQSLEVLCVKAGNGALAADGVELQLKEAKPLPSSD
ncbi:MAG: hypothetical protein AB7Q97_05495 [Gammaproteobacteria bacterium]